MQTVALTIREQAALLGFSQAVKTCSNPIQAGAATFLAHRNKTLHVQKEQRGKRAVLEVTFFCPGVMGGGTGELASLGRCTF